MGKAQKGGKVRMDMLIRRTDKSLIVMAADVARQSITEFVTGASVRAAYQTIAMALIELPKEQRRDLMRDLGPFGLVKLKATYEAHARKMCEFADQMEEEFNLKAEAEHPK